MALLTNAVLLLAIAAALAICGIGIITAGLLSLLAIKFVADLYEIVAYYVTRYFKRMMTKQGAQA